MSMLRRRGRKNKGKKRRNKTKQTKKSVPLPRLHRYLMEDIFHKLPFKDVVRTRLVCKRWNSIISSPEFMDHVSIKKGNHLILLELENHRNFGFYWLSTSNTIHKLSTSPSAVPLKDHKKWGMSKYALPRLIGSYNGIVALSCQGEKLVLWNPVTGKHTSIEMQVYDTNSYFNNFDPRLLFGLYYDSSTDEYSVVVGSDYQSPPVSPSCFNGRIDYESTPVFLYNFKDGSYRVLDSALSRRLLDRKLFNGEAGKVICGIPHWVVKYYDFRPTSGVETEILYFDLKAEKFKQMARPDCGADKTMLGLAAMNGENELGCVLHDVGSSNLEVWVMKEYGKVESWTNLFIFPCVNVIGNFERSVRYMDVLGITPSGELLVFLNDKKFWVYDIETGVSRKLVLEEDAGFSFVVPFQPTLISPPRSIKETTGVTECETHSSSSREETENETSDLSSEDES